MKTTPLDSVLVTSCVSGLIVASGLTAHMLAWSGDYRLLFEVLLFLLAYGLYSMALLAIVRRFTPYPSGTFDMDSAAFTHWKLNAVLVDLATKALSPFRLVFTEALLHAGFGARVGSNVAIAGVLRDHPLLEIGAGATIGQNSVITAHAITFEEIVLRPVRIGRGAVVGINAVVMPGVELGEDAVLAPGSVAITDTKIPSNELWGGTPARRIKDLSRPSPRNRGT